MKKIWIIMTGIILMLTCFSACSEEVGTPTDVPSAATTVQNQTINQSGDKDVSTPSQEDLQDASTEISNKNPSLEGSSVPSENSTISTVSNVTTPSENTSPQENQPVAFEQPAWETDTFYFRANAENGCFAVACTTYQEFLDFLDSDKIRFNLDGAGNQVREPYLSQFPPTYFAQGNSLLIYYYYANNLATRSCVKEVSFDQGTLAVTIETKAPASDAVISCDYTPKGYMCKLLNHSEPIDQIRVTVNRLKGDQFIKTETNTHQN